MIKNNVAFEPVIMTGCFQSGSTLKISLITIMRMEDGKVVEEWQEDDQLGFARQLGMELKPKESEN